jgi:uncharacterized repeat protein (TIGR03803 family)
MVPAPEHSLSPRCRIPHAAQREQGMVVLCAIPGNQPNPLLMFGKITHMRSMLSFSRTCLAGCLAASSWFVTGQAAEGPSYELIYSFQGLSAGGGPDGEYPTAGLTYANGTFYGTTMRGGTTIHHVNYLDVGTIFSITGGTERVIYSFGEPRHGREPTSGVTEVGGLLYGTAEFGHDNRHGMVFQFNPTGGEQVEHRFHKVAQGDAPGSSLLYKNGRFFGTTSGNGPGYGTVFSITPSGHKRVLYAFTGGRDGANPTVGLTDIGGTLYGVTSAGGLANCAGGCGTVFKLVPGGIQVIYRFQGGSDGSAPEAALVGIGGTIYGTTSTGGTGGCSLSAPLPGCGTVFKLTPAGAETVLHSFIGGADGSTDGDFGGSLTAVGHVLYGTTREGGPHSACSAGCGTIFKITEDGRETVLHAFDYADGGYPAYAAKLVYVSGSLYGTTEYGGAYQTGTVFRLTP